MKYTYRFIYKPLIHLQTYDCQCQTKSCHATKIWRVLKYVLSRTIIRLSSTAVCNPNHIKIKLNACCQVVDVSALGFSSVYPHLSCVFARFSPSNFNYINIFRKLRRSGADRSFNWIRRKDGNVLFNDTLNTLYFTDIWCRTYGKGPLRY